MTTNDEIGNRRRAWNKARKHTVVSIGSALTVLAAALMLFGHVSEGSLILTALISAAGAAATGSTSRQR